MNYEPIIKSIKIKDVYFGENVTVIEPVNLYGCSIGENTCIGPFVEIQKNVSIGKKCKIQSHSFICDSVSIGDNCFISHGVKFINDKFSRGKPAGGDRKLWGSTYIEDNVYIGTNATILPVKIVSNTVIGAGAVVTKDITEPGVYVGNPARKLVKVSNGLAEEFDLNTNVEGVPQNLNIPLLDLKRQYQNIKYEIDEAIQQVVSSTAFIGGQFVRQFETEFAGFCNAKHCVGVGNGTDALFLTLKALNIGSNDEVITVANSFIATSEAISATGAKVVFVDCHPQFYTLDVAKLEEKITSKTKAIIPVQLYGQPADMTPILEIAEHYHLFVIEDAAQAHGARYHENIVGTFGDAACFSFYPGKNLGAYGDAGAVVTNNDELAKRCRMIANHGRIDKYNHEFEGYNSRLDALQSAVLSVKLKYLAEWNKRRGEIAKIYDENLNKASVIIPQKIENSSHVYHLYVIRTRFRNELSAYLKEKRIQTGIHYPVGLPFLKAYSYLHHQPSDFPNTFKFQNEILSLPIYPELLNSEQEYVIDSINRFFENKIKD